MASAQVLPSSRKQEHLEAGKKRLEEFRKKKAAERAKKAAATSQPNSSDVSLEKQPSETEQVRITVSDGAGTSDGPVGASINNDKSSNDFNKKVEQSSVKDDDANPPSTSDYNASIGDLMQRQVDTHDFAKDNASGFTGGRDDRYGQGINVMNNESRMYKGNDGRISYGISSDYSIAQHPQSSQGFDSSSNQPYLNGTEIFHSQNNSSSKDSTRMRGGSHVLASLPISANSHLQTNPSYTTALATDVSSIQSITGASLDFTAEHDKRSSMLFNDHTNSNFGEKDVSSLPSGYGASFNTYEPTGYSFDVRNSSSYAPSYSTTSDTNSRRSRPSFLDSLNVSKGSSGNSFLQTEAEGKSNVGITSKSNGMDARGSSLFGKPSLESDTMGPLSKLRPSDGPSEVDNSTNFSASSNNGVDLVKSNVNESIMEGKHEFYSHKQNEDFAALEQHIEDLTQEKFSLQRALEASRVLAELLAAENSSLTDNYNQQRSVVNQLKSEMEMIQEEIKAHLAELESVRSECANAQLECNAADERAKLLASEVIGLEEKALRLRSGELKLERQLENAHAEMSSFKKKIASLERDRQDLHSTIDALQEEKKLLQSKLRKASASGKSSDAIRSITEKKEMSTSTEDLDYSSDTSDLESHIIESLSTSGAPSFPVIPEMEQLNLEVLSVNFPPDQARMIQNINALISELALEKEELVQTLASKSSQCLMLKASNSELLRKLENQTQRLELLTAQSMASENIPARLPDPNNIQYNTTYADEGDEVVERVLGWIMKLFPGGPSRRRPGKRL